MTINNISPGSESASSLLSKEYFDEELINLEAGLIFLQNQVLTQVSEGYFHIVDVPYPIVPVSEDAYLPAGSPDIYRRLQLGLHRAAELSNAQELYGFENVWLGPALKASYPELSPAEQRGIWVKT